MGRHHSLLFHRESVISNFTSEEYAALKWQQEYIQRIRHRELGKGQEQGFGYANRKIQVGDEPRIVVREISMTS